MLWPIEDGRDCAVPFVRRIAVVPLSGMRPAFGNQPYFDPMDPSDVDIFQYDWSVIAFSGDAIVHAEISATRPAPLTIGAPTVSGYLVQSFIGPLVGPAQTVEVTCIATFASGRVLDWDTEISFRSL